MALALVTRTNGDADGSPTAVRARIRIHLHEPGSLDDAELELPVIRPGVGEDLDTTEQRAEIADQDARGLPVVPLGAVDLDVGAESLRAQIARSAPDVRGAAEPVLEVVGVADHAGVEAGARHHGEALTLEAADVEPPRRAAEPDRHRAP